MTADLDPFLVQAVVYRAGLKACDDLPDDISDAELNAVAAATWRPFYEAETYPAPTTARGAAEALRVALEEEGDASPFVTAMMQAALAYLDRRTHPMGGAGRHDREGGR